VISQTPRRRPTRSVCAQLAASPNCRPPPEPLRSLADVASGPAPRTIQKPSHKIKVPISRSGSFYSAWILHASSNVAAGVIVAINTAA